MDKIYQGEYKITSPFGERNLNGDKRFHKGEDHVGVSNKTIIAPTNGKIISSWMVTDKSNSTWEWGNYVKMDDLNGFYLFFCHLNTRLVRVGDVVVESQPIGIEGYTGYVFPPNAKGSHCHFEVRRKSDDVSIDPREYFKILADWKESYYRQLTKERFNFDENTMKYLDKHPYPQALFKKLSTAK